MKFIKNILCLFCLFAVTSCVTYSGKKIKEDEAHKIATNIVNDYIPGRTIITDSAIVQKDSKENYKFVARIIDNPDGDFYFKGTYTLTNKTGAQIRKKIQEVFIVKNDEYEEVFYSNTSDTDANPKKQIVVIAKKGNDSYESATRQVFKVDNCVYYYPYEENSWTGYIHSSIDNSLDNVVMYPGYKVEFFTNDNKYDLTIKETYPNDDNKYYSAGLQTETRFSRYGVTLIKEVVPNEGSLTQKVKYSSHVKVTLPNDWRKYLA